MSIGRRKALKTLLALGASGTAAKVLGGEAAEVPRPEEPFQPHATARTTEDLYRQEFAATYGDGEAHGASYHCVNCQGNCAWDVWVDGDGRITRETQSASYPPIAKDVPDANPRGC